MKTEAEPFEQMKTYWGAANREEGMEYSIVLVSEAGETNQIQDFSENKEFTLLADEYGVCTIRARMRGNVEEFCNMEIFY